MLESLEGKIDMKSYSKVSLLTALFAITTIAIPMFLFASDTPINSRTATGTINDIDSVPTHDASENSGATRSVSELKEHILSGMDVDTVTNADNVEHAQTVTNATNVTQQVFGDDAAYYYPDNTEADQGVTAVGSGDTIYDVMQEVGTSGTTVIVLRKGTLDGETNYALDTSIDLTTYPNIFFIIQNGARLTRVTGDETITIYNPERLIITNEQQITATGLLAFSQPGIVYAEWWGATGDGSTDDSTAIQNAINCLGDSSGGVVQLLSKTYVCGNLEMKSYVFLKGASPIGYYTHAAGVRGSYQTVLLANTAGDIVGTPATTVNGIGVENIGFVGLGSGTATKGLYLDDSDRGTFRYLSFDNFADQAIRIDEGAANEFVRIIAINCLLNTSRSAKIGVIDIGGITTDNFFDKIESTASLSALTDANLYICAWAFQAPGGSNNFVRDCIGEIADVGFYIASDWNRFIGCRADLNYGHGFQLASTAGSNIFSGCLAFRNSQNNDNTYDGFNIASGDSNNTFSGCVSQSLATDSWQQQYGFNDATNGSAGKNIYSGCYGGSNQTGLYNGNAYLGNGFPVNPGWKEFTADDATPSVSGGKLFWFNAYTGATDITDFDDATPGQEIRVTDISADGYITIKNNTNIITNTGADKNISQNDIHTFVSRNGVWYEIE